VSHVVRIMHSVLALFRKRVSLLKALQRMPLTAPCSTSTLGPLYNIYFMYMIMHLRAGVGWNLAALGLFPLHEYLVYPHDGLEH
jgi:hypothetical protein